MTVGEGRQRLDKTLLSHALADKASVRSLVYNQILKSPPAADGKDSSNRVDSGKPGIEVTDRYTAEAWNILEDLRSTSGDDIGRLGEVDESVNSPSGWKLKEETSRFRVMYRPGSEGSPFHTLCLEGIMEGHIVNSLCVGWEAPLFKEWWPQFVVPTFKIVESRWVQRVRVGEDLALVRFKVPSGEIDEKAYGFGSADVPQTPHYAVRMDLAGGFAVQKMASGLSYFRSIVNVDMKLDFVPPWIINFISRQLAGQGYKLFQKAVLQVESGKDGKAFQQLVQTQPLYARIMEGLDSAEKFEFGKLPPVSGKIAALRELTRDKGKSLQGSLRRLGSAENYRVAPCPEAQPPEEKAAPGTPVPSSVPLLSPPVDSESMEPTFGGTATLPLSPESMVGGVQEGEPSTSTVSAGQDATDPEVKWALEVIEKMIAYVRQHGPGAIPVLQPQEQEFNPVEESKQAVAHELVCSETPQLRRSEVPQVGTLEKIAEDVTAGSSLADSRRPVPRKPVMKKPPVVRPPTDRKVAGKAQRSRRWSVFNCMPTRLTKKEPLRIEKPPGAGSGSTVKGDSASAKTIVQKSQVRVPSSSSASEEIVSLGELFTRETRQT